MTPHVRNLLECHTLTRGQQAEHAAKLQLLHLASGTGLLPEAMQTALEYHRERFVATSRSLYHLRAMIREIVAAN